MKRWILIQWYVVLFIAPLNGWAQFFAADKIYQKCVDAVVIVSTSGGFGTGFFINEQGTVLTNYHVVETDVQTPWNVTVITKSGDRLPVIAIDPVLEEPNLDIAILTANPSRATPYLPLKPQGAVVGEEVVAIGHPNGDWWNQSKGIISKISLQENPTLLQHDVAADEGNSGGPLINGKGQVVGVVTGYKLMRSNEGWIKLQQTGQRATKISAVIPVLRRRGIRYYTHGIVVEGLTEYERQFQQLQKEREMLERDREQLRRERQQLEQQRRQLERAKAAFERQKYESQYLLQEGSRLRAELEQQREEIQRQLEQLNQQRREIAEKLQWIREKEAQIYARLEPRFSLELGLHPAYLYHDNAQQEYGQLGVSAGLFYRFGFVRDAFGVVESSDRVGITYTYRKMYAPQLQSFLHNAYHDIAVELEFSDVFRLGIGTSLQRQDLYFGYPAYTFALMGVNFTGYPVAFGMEIAWFTDNRFRLRNYVLGAFFKIALDFLRV